MQLSIPSRRVLSLLKKILSSNEMRQGEREREREETEISTRRRGRCERGGDEARGAVSDAGDRIGGIISLNLEN